jgi:GNAT superfamily N-acetyltransferase
MEWRQDDGRVVGVRSAVLSDLENLRSLYRATYGDRYALPEVVDDARSREVIEGHDWVWLLAECEGNVVGSLIFGWDPEHRLGKSFAGVVDADFRGHKTMQRMLTEGLDRLLYKGTTFDLVYAVVRTFVTPAFHQDLFDLGFIDVGVFPNVRKVRSYETHGLKICVSPRTLERRRRQPYLIPQASTLYQIVADRFKLEAARFNRQVVPELRNRRDLRVELAPVAEAGVGGVTRTRIQMLRRSSRGLKFGFFPFHEPNQILSDPTGQVRVFLSHQETDGHSSILGVDPGPYEPVQVLLSVAEYCEERGAVYLELLVSAYEPRLQAAAYLAGFLPCGYFMGAMMKGHERHDVIVTSRTFVPLHFSGLRLTESAKPFLLEFFKVYTERLWEDLLDA